MTIRNKELIQAVLDGKQLEIKTISQRTGFGWWMATPENQITSLLDGSVNKYHEFRIKKEPLVSYAGVFKDGTLSCSSHSDAFLTMHKKAYVHMIRIEVDPDTHEPLSISLHKD